MVFVLDNYDSFTYNLVQYLGELGADVVVRRNDELTVEEVESSASPIGYFFRQGHAPPAKPASWCRLYGTWQAKPPSWVCALVTRPSVKPSAARSFVHVT